MARREPLVDRGPGHGCGHNLLGAGALLAAATVKEWLAATGTPGRVRYYGCPAEEGGSAKGFLVRAGLFDDVDIAISWHPAPFAAVNTPISLACNELLFEFEGRAAHAAACPELGRSALDAVELMNVGVNYMREHMPQSARIHYAVTDTGGIAPNVVQAHAAVRYLIRARELDELHQLVARVRKIAAGAALMTETEVSDRVVSGDANLIGNTPLEQLMQAELERLGPPVFAAEDDAFAGRDPGDPDPRGHSRRVRPLRRSAGAGHRALRCGRAAGQRDRLERRLDRRRDRQLGGAHGADARRDLCDRHARSLLAARRAGKIRHRPQGHGARRKGDGGDRQGALR